MTFIKRQLPHSLVLLYKANLASRILDFIKDLGGAPGGQPKLADTPLGMNVGIFTGMNFPIAPKEYFTEKLFVIPRADAFHKQNVLCLQVVIHLKSLSHQFSPSQRNC